jgi:hypothetical protein
MLFYYFKLTDTAHEIFKHATLKLKYLSADEFGLCGARGGKAPAYDLPDV